MELKFQSLSIFQFQELFPDNDACYQYLLNLKWANGFECEKCGHRHYCKGKSPYSRQCTKCRYQASPTSGTLFHKLKFPLLKAFYIVYYMSTSKKGMASTELSRKLSLRQKTCWLFSQKVMKAMSSSGQHPMQGHVEVDETVVGGQEKGVRGRENHPKKLVVIAIERKSKGIGRIYAKVIKNSSHKQFKPFFEQHIHKKAKIRTDLWNGYLPLKKQYPNLEGQASGKKGENFKLMHRAIMMFKAWLRGTHHSVRNLQAYIDQYTYRFNRHFMKEEIFDNLMKRMVQRKPCNYKQICMR